MGNKHHSERTLILNGFIRCILASILSGLSISLLLSLIVLLISNSSLTS